MTDAESTTDDAVPVHLVVYEDDADLDVQSDGEDFVVENHDDLVNAGQTYDEIRGMNRSSAEEHNLDIVEPGSLLWDDRFEDIEVGDAYRLEGT